MEGTYLQLFEKHNTLETERMLLRPYRLEDAEDVLKTTSNRNNTRYTLFEGLDTLEQAKDSIINLFSTRPGFYAMELKENGNVMGNVSLNMNHLKHDKVSFGYMIDEDYWNKGYVTEAFSALVELCFQVIGIHKIEGEYLAPNIGSGRVMEKVGMVKEGVRKASVKKRGQSYDLVLYGITKEAWEDNNNK